jgi:hypothetical protein
MVLSRRDTAVVVAALLLVVRLVLAAQLTSARPYMDSCPSSPIREQHVLRGSWRMSSMT